MTPTEQEIEFFREAKRIQEEWEPSQDDWAILKGKHVHQRPLLVVQTNWGGGVVYLFGTMQKARDKDTVIWLPRQGQLQAMLEEKGYRWDVGKLPDSYTATIWNDDVDLECEGPTPSIALGRALIEVLKEE